MVLPTPCGVEVLREELLMSNPRLVIKASSAASVVAAVFEYAWRSFIIRQTA